MLEQQLKNETTIKGRIIGYDRESERVNNICPQQTLLWEIPNLIIM